MEHIQEIESNIAQAYEMIDRLFRNNKGKYDENAYQDWKEEKIKDSVFFSDIEDPEVREVFSYYLIVINEFKQEAQNKRLQNILQFNYSC